jgi:hypothetical protein
MAAIPPKKTRLIKEITRLSKRVITDTDARMKNRYNNSTRSIFTVSSAM